MNTLLKSSKLLLILLSCSLATGCGDSNDNHAQSTIKVIHNSPDAPNVDVLVDNSIALTNVPYGVISNDLPLESGERNISVTVAGTNQEVIGATLDLSANLKYLIFASDLVSKIKPIVLVTDNNTPTSGNSRVRVLHGAPSAPKVDIYATALNAPIESATPVLSNVSFGESSGYLTVPSGIYQLRVTIAGTKTVAIDSGSVNLVDKSSYTVFAKDDVGGGAPFSLGIILE
jgi:hypothetical protein